MCVEGMGRGVVDMRGGGRMRRGGTDIEGHMKLLSLLVSVPLYQATQTKQYHCLLYTV